MTQKANAIREGFHCDCGQVFVSHWMCVSFHSAWVACAGIIFILFHAFVCPSTEKLCVTCTVRSSSSLI